MSNAIKIDLIEGETTSVAYGEPVCKYIDIRMADREKELPDINTIIKEPVAFTTEDGILKYQVILQTEDGLKGLRIELVCTEGDRVKVEKVIATLDRNVSIEQYKQNLEQAISNAII